MKHLKIIGLLAVASAVTMAFAANAAADKLTSPTGTQYATGSTIKATSGTTNMTGAFVTPECHVTWQGTVTSQGTGTQVTISLSSLAFETCNFTTIVKKAGTLAFTATTTGNEVNGTVKSTGTEVEVLTSLGTCIFTTSSTDIGTFTGGKTASIDISGTIPRTAGNFLCGSSAVWEGSFSILTPDELWLDKS